MPAYYESPGYYYGGGAPEAQDYSGLDTAFYLGMGGAMMGGMYGANKIRHGSTAAGRAARKAGKKAGGWLASGVGMADEYASSGFRWTAWNALKLAPKAAMAFGKGAGWSYRMFRHGQRGFRAGVWGIMGIKDYEKATISVKGAFTGGAGIKRVPKWGTSKYFRHRNWYGHLARAPKFMAQQAFYGGLFIAGQAAYERYIKGVPAEITFRREGRNLAMFSLLAVAGATVGSVIPIVGSAAGMIAGSILGYSIGNSTPVNEAMKRLTGRDWNRGFEVAELYAQGLGSRNPFRPGAHPFEVYSKNSMEAVTSRQRSLMAIHKSPLNDRALLLGREAQRIHS